MNTKKLTIISIALCLLVIFGSILTSAQTPDVRPLTIGQPVERELKGDEAHSYSLALKAGQYLDLAVEQKGIDVVVTLFDANGKKADEVDSPNGITGEEPLSFIVETGGNYRLEIRSLEKTAAAGRYEVKIKELRTATEKDKTYVAAQKAFNEGELLKSERNPESLQSAIKKYEESLTLYKAINDKIGSASTLSAIAYVYSILNEQQKALEYLNQALLLYKEIQDKQNEAATLNAIAFNYYNIGDKQKALDYLKQALPLRQLIEDKSGEATTLNGIGAIYSDFGEPQKALDYLNKALLIRRSINDKGGEAVTLNVIGIVYERLGETQKALEVYNQSLKLRQILNDTKGEATILNNIGKIYSDSGEKQKALEYYGEAILKYRINHDKRGEANTLDNIAAVYDALGDKQKAFEYLMQALPLRQAVNDRNGEAITLNNIGKVLSNLGKKQEALEYFNKALLILKSVGNRQVEATTLNNMSGVYRDLGETQKTLNLLNQVLEIFRIIGDRNSEAGVLNNVGVTYFDLGEKQKALESYSKALPLLKLVRNKNGETATFDNINSVWQSLNNQRFAIFYGKQSVNGYQQLRSNVQGLNKNLQQTYLKSIEGTYSRLADALIEQKRYAEAQQVLNSFKDQQFFDFNQNKQLAPLVFTAREAELTAMLNQKLENVVAAIRTFDEYKRSVGERALTADETAQLKRLEAKQIAANDDYLAFLKSAEKEFAAPLDGKDKVPVISDLTELQTALREVSAQTGEKSVAVYTLVGVDNFRALVITPDSIFSVSTPIKGAMLNEKAKQLWSLLRTPEFDPQPLAKEIYGVIFAPLAAKLPADTKTIMWSLDGNLRYLPMAALHDGKGYLVESYNNVIFTRADTERLTRDISANLNGTGFGATQKRSVKIGDENFNAIALPSVKNELARIFKTADSPTGVLSGEVLLDERFTRATMISNLQKRRPFVHIASHFVFVPGDEAKSFLVLGDGSPFTLGEMKEEKNLFADVELLALSACETAAQEADTNGREVDGFAELAQRLGAGAVMASLWNVSDDSTAELMAQFYKNYNNQKGTNKASSLRAAQLAILRGKIKTAGIAKRQATPEDAEIKSKIKIENAKQKPFVATKSAPLAHPFYWSPFILIGNWK